MFGGLAVAVGLLGSAYFLRSRRARDAGQRSTTGKSATDSSAPKRKRVRNPKTRLPAEDPDEREMSGGKKSLGGRKVRAVKEVPTASDDVEAIHARYDEDDEEEEDDGEDDDDGEDEDDGEEQEDEDEDVEEQEDEILGGEQRASTTRAKKNVDPESESHWTGAA